MEYTLLLIAIGILAIIVIKNILAKKKKKARFNGLIEKFGEKFGSQIANKKIDIGMTSKMLKLSWGKPLKMDGKVIRENYVKENYYYGAYKNQKGKTQFRFQIILENDKVTEIRKD